MTNTRVSKTAGLILLFVLVITSLSPLVLNNNIVNEEGEFINLTENKQLPAEARSGSATAWLKETVDNDGDTGQWTSSAIASDGSIWVAFYSAAGRELKAAHWGGSSWNVNTVYSFGDIGKYAEIDIDSNNNPRIASYDITNGVLRISRYDGTSWSTGTVAPGDDSGNGNPYAG